MNDAAHGMDTLTGTVLGPARIEHHEVSGHDHRSTAELQFTVTTTDGREVQAHYSATPMETTFPKLSDGDPITLYGSDNASRFDVESYRHSPASPRR